MLRRQVRFLQFFRTWAVLRHVHLQADVPVVQFSIDETQPASFHYEIGKRIAPLREEGVLIVGSGNLMHNPHAYAWGRHTVEPYDWVVAFERRSKLAYQDLMNVRGTFLRPA